MIHRPAHGATRRPPVERPGSGFGRPIKPRPPAALRGTDAVAAARDWDPRALLVPDPVEVPAPVLPRDDAALTS